MGQHGFASVKAPIRSGPACDRPVRDRSQTADRQQSPWRRLFTRYNSKDSRMRATADRQ